VDSLSAHSTLIVDVETNGLDYTENQICGIGVGTLEGETHYFPFRHEATALMKNLSIDLLSSLIGLLNKLEAIIGYNIKFDLHFLVDDGLEVEEMELIDVLIPVRLTTHSNIKKLNLTTTIARDYGEEHAAYDIKTKQIMVKNKWHKNFALTPIEVLGPYCEKDVYWTGVVYRDRMKRVMSSGMEAVFNIQKRLTKALFFTEHRGFSISQKALESIEERIEARLATLIPEVHKVFANGDEEYEEINLGSSPQIHEAFARIGVKGKLTEKGNPSWKEDNLIAIDHPMCGKIREVRALNGVLNKYFKDYRGRDVLHGSLNNFGTLTGRLSASNPPLQTLPREFYVLNRDEDTFTEDRLEEVRGHIKGQVATKSYKADPNDLSFDTLKAWTFLGQSEGGFKDNDNLIHVKQLFVSRPEFTNFAYDYSQMEVRTFLKYVNSPESVAMLNSGLDLHTSSTKLVFAKEVAGLSEKSKTFEHYRQMVKAINFGIIFGMGDKALARAMSEEIKYAREMKKKYVDKLGGADKFMKAVIDTVERRGWVKNMFGRVYLVNPKVAYKAINYLVQGTSADILNERMCELYELLKDKKSNMLLQIHDEVIVEVHDDEWYLVPQIKDCLENIALDIPMIVSVEICQPSWANKIDLGKYLQTKDRYDIMDMFGYKKDPVLQKDLDLDLSWMNWTAYEALEAEEMAERLDSIEGKLKQLSTVEERLNGRE